MTKGYETGVYVVTTARGDSFRAWGPDEAGDFCYLHDPLSGYATSGVTQVRPLVVLDPESEDDCRRLMEAALAHRSAAIPTLETIRGILRALADQKPPEPTGLGAVVRDRFGKRWIRVGDGDGHDAQVWYRVDPDHAQERMTTWDGLVDPAEVLSEGWSE